MKKTLHLLMLIIIYLLCGARSCSESDLKDGNEKNLISASKDSIKKAIEIDIPDTELLKTHEQMAKQKLLDFADYMKIVSDTTIDARFRQQAAEMARKLFISGQINIRNWDIISEHSKNRTLNQFLAKNLNEGSTYWIQLEGIDIAKPLSQTNDSAFIGRLSVYKSSLSFEKQLVTKKYTEKVLVDFHLQKKTKSFGNDRVKVWEVYLGEIY